MLRLYRINCKYPSEDWEITEDYIDINVGTVLGEGRICKAWMGKISAPGDPLRNQNPIVIKKLVRYKEEKDLIYKKRVFTYLNNSRAYSRMYNENPRGTSKVEGAYTDGCNYYILQVFYPGCTYREWESTSLLKEVDMIVKIIEVVKAYHDVKDENGKIMPQFIGDLKPENFYVPIMKNSETVDIVYFDFDVYDSATESGTHSYSNRYLSYLCLSDSEDARRRNDVTCIVLMLYERLFSTKKGVVLPRRKRIGKSRLPIGEYQFPDYVNAGKEVNRRLKNIFENGLLQKYSTCEMLYKDIAELREILKVMDATEVIFQTINTYHEIVGEKKFLKNNNSDNPGEKRVQIVDYADLVEKGFTALTIARELVKNDNNLYENANENEGTAEQWADYLSTYPETFLYLINERNQIVGNYSMMGLSEEHYEQVIKGRFLEANCDISESEWLVFPGIYKGYILNFSINEPYNTTYNYNMLITAFIEQITRFAQNGIYFSEWYVNVFTRSHIAMYRRLGFKYIIDNVCSGKIYGMNFIPFPADNKIFGKHKELKRLYEEI